MEVLRLLIRRSIRGNLDSLRVWRGDNPIEVSSVQWIEDMNTTVDGLPRTGVAGWQIEQLLRGDGLHAKSQRLLVAGDWPVLVNGWTLVWVLQVYAIVVERLHARSFGAAHLLDRLSPLAHPNSNTIDQSADGPPTFSPLA